MINLTHHIDQQSHEIGMLEVTDDGAYTFDFTDIVGRGCTQEEAMNDFRQKFNRKLRELIEFQKILSGKKTPGIVEVGYKGSPIRDCDVRI